MQLRFALSTFMMLAGAPALAQPPAGTAPPAGAAAAGQPAQPPQPSPAEIGAIQQAGQGFGTCISGGIQNVPDSATPEAGAAGVMAGCAAQRQALVQAVEAMLANMPEPQRTEGHAQMESQLGEAQTQVADAIRQHRAAAAAPAASAPPATPPPH
jgi:hypothetical protein